MVILFEQVDPCKPAWCDVLVAIFQVAQNLPKFDMSTHSVLKNVSVFFFKKAEKYNILTKSRQNPHTHFFTEKELAWQISADSEQLEKLLQNFHIEPACTDLSFGYDDFVLINQLINW